MLYMSVKEASLKWGLSEVLIRRYCSQGRVEGAIQDKGSWKIPFKAKRPGRIVVVQEEVSPFVNSLYRIIINQNQLFVSLNVSTIKPSSFLVS